MERVVHTGYPVRAGIGRGDRLEARRSLGIPPGAFTVLAFGGSGGARSLNRGLVDALPSLLSRGEVHVVHGTGRHVSDEYDPLGDTAARVDALGLDADALGRYHRLEYIDDMSGAYAAADLVVCRAGAGTLSEVRAAALPAVLVPKIGLPHEHQLANARDLEQAGCAWLVREEPVAGRPGRMGLPAGALASRLLALVDAPEEMRRMRERLGARPVPATEVLIGGIMEDLVRAATGRSP
jgi:UDP-N-acetylglucosamine--N-acetylmuramyl-(pentapeptide) pyrophosphoryl-undecaprenol N-acetylglucosamine transferase